jgi:Alkyl sulfatase C-terminal/Alkyl sulfatase dimerisation
MSAPCTPRNWACGTATRYRCTGTAPVESAKRYVDLIGADKILAEGRRAFDAADYRWAAEILHKLVFAQPDNQDARNLQADTHEQMGYQIEGPQWRGMFLTAAKEFRDGVAPAAFATASPDTILAMPIDILFDFAAVHLIGDKASQADIRIDFAFSDLDRTWTVWVRRGVLNARQGASSDTQLTVSGPRAALVGVVLQPAAAEKLAAAGKIQLDGDQSVLTEFAGLMDEFDPNFNIITPRRPPLRSGQRVINRPSPGPIDLRSVADHQDVHRLGVFVESTDDPVVTTARRPPSRQFPLQRLTPPSRIIRQAPKDERHQRLGHPRRNRAQAAQGARRQNSLILAHAFSGKPSDCRTSASV